MATDRLADGYEPDFDIDYQVGHQAELFVKSLIDSLAAGRIEVKRDARAADTGNIYVETECKRMGVYRPSGIAATKADAWAFVLSDDLVVITTTTGLRRAMEHGSIAGCPRGSHPTRGVLIRIPDLFQRLGEVDA